MPTAADGEVVVEVRAAGINPGEAVIRSGALESRFPRRSPRRRGKRSRGSGVRDRRRRRGVLGRRRGAGLLLAPQQSRHLRLRSHEPPDPQALEPELGGRRLPVRRRVHCLRRRARRGPQERATPSRSRLPRAVWHRSSCSSCGCSGAEVHRHRLACERRLADCLTAPARSPMATGLPSACKRQRRTASTRSSTSSDPSTSPRHRSRRSPAIASRRSPPSRRPQELGTKADGSVPPPPPPPCSPRWPHLAASGADRGPDRNDVSARAGVLTPSPSSKNGTPAERSCSFREPRSNGSPHT